MKLLVIFLVALTFLQVSAVEVQQDTIAEKVRENLLKAIPRIGIPYSRSDYEKLGQGEDIYKNYRNALTAAGSWPVPVVVGKGAVEAQLSGVDAVLVPGGIDVEPSRYGERRSPLCGKSDPEFDDFEIAVIHYALREDLPMLCICRGMQLLNVALGGTLYQDLPEECGTVMHQRSKEEKKRLRDTDAYHEVYYRRGSKIADVLGSGRDTVNSNHHQALKDLAPSLSVTGISQDGIVESVEAGGTFIIGVQYHPERLLKKSRKYGLLFKELTRHARINWVIRKSAMSK